MPTPFPGDPMANIPTTSDATFEADVLHADLPVLVDFGAEWCHPCKQLDPIVEELAAELTGRGTGGARGGSR